MKKHRRRTRWVRHRTIIAPSAVEAFRKRRLDDFRWLKKVPRSELREALEWKDFVTEPRTSQLVCSLIGQNEPRFLFLLDMGLGKTKIVLDLIRYRKSTGQLKAALVCVPNIINLVSWKRQAEEHAPDLSVVVLEGTRKEREALLNETSADLYVINYAGLAVYGTIHQATGNNKAARRVLNPEQLDAFCSCFNFVVFDELHLLGDHTTLTFALAKHLSVKADYVYGLTGTPFGRDPQRMWSLFNVVDLGETLGKTLGIYRASFFREKPDFWAGVVYEFDHKYKMLLHRVLQHRSIRYLEHEVGDVPKVQKQVLEFPLTEEQQEHYNRIRGLITESGGDAETLKNTYIRSRQLTAGFMTLTGEDDRKIQIQFKVSAKVVALAALIEQLPEGAKLVIFHQYIYSGVLIQELLQKHKIKFAGVGHGFKDSELQLQRFVSHPDYRAFVANVGAGGTGVDGLQKVCHYGVFFESPSDPKLRAQCEKRLARSGQRHKVFLYDLAAQGTVDAKILRYLEEGRDLFEAVCNGKVKSL